MGASKGVRMGAVALVIAIAIVAALFFLKSPVSNEQMLVAVQEKTAPSVLEIPPEKIVQKVSENKISFASGKTSVAEIKFSSLETSISNVSSKLVKPKNTAFKSQILVVENAEFREAEITLSKSGNVDAIFYCSDFDFENETCYKNWERTKIPFTQTENSVSFKVVHFSAYVAGSYEIMASFGGSGDCGKYVNNDSVLTADIVNCSTFGLYFNASNITLDCQGHKIRGKKAGLWEGLGFQSSTIKNVTIKNCDVSNFSTGFYATSNNMSSIINSSFDGNTRGMQLYYVDRFNLSQSSVSGNSQSGLESTDCTNCFFYNNTLTVNTFYGFYLFYYSGNKNLTLVGNYISSNGGTGIKLEGMSDNLLFANNTINEDNVEFSKDVAGQSKLTIFNNSFSNLIWFSLSGFTNISFTNNNISDGNGGILFVNCEDINVSNNFASSVLSYAFDFSGSTGIVSNNNVSYSSAGFYSSGGSKLSFNNNLAENTGGDGFLFDDSEIRNLNNNIAKGNANAGFSYGLFVTLNSSGYFENNSATQNGIGFQWSGNGSDQNMHNNSFFGNVYSDLDFICDVDGGSLFFTDSTFGDKLSIDINCNYVNFSNVKFLTNYSSIKYDNLLLSNVTTVKPFILGNNSIFVNSTKYPVLNKSANITFFDLPWGSAPQIRKDGVLCSSPACNLTSYSASTGELNARVASFSNYTTNGSTCVNVTDDLYINKNSILCAGTYYVNDTGASGVIIINKSGVKLDVESGGVVLTGNGLNVAIYAENKENITLEPSAIFRINNFGVGVYFYNVRNGTVGSFTFSGCSRSVSFNSNTRDSIIRPVYQNFTILSGVSGIHIFGGSGNSIINNNSDRKILIQNQNLFGIELYSTEGVNVSGVETQNVVEGLYLDNSANISITESKLNATSNGVNINRSNNITLSGNAYISGLSGVRVTNSKANIFSNNFSSTGQDVLINASSSVNLSGNLFSGNSSYALNLTNSNASINNIFTKPILKDSSSIINAINLTFYDPNASISFINELINDTVDTATGLFLMNNLAGIEPSISPGLNKNATIVLIGLSWLSPPFIEKDGVRCDNTSACSLVSYDNLTGTLIFNANGFSNYSSSTSTPPGTPDSNPPTLPTVYDGLNFIDYNWTNNLTSLKASWNNSFDRSNIFYSYRIMDNSSCYNGSCAFKSVGSAQQVTVSNLSLVLCHNYTFEVQAEDTFYNIANVSKSDGITVETNSPGMNSVSSSTHPNPSMAYPSSTVSFQWNATDSGLCPSGIAGYSYVLDQDSYTYPDSIIDTNATNVTLTNVPNGIWNFHIIPIDYAGNLGSASILQVRINSTEVNIKLNPAETPTLNASVKISGQIAKNVSDKLLMYVNNNNTQNITISPTQTLFNFTINLDMGINVVYANASLNGSIVGKSNTLYIRRVNETRVNATGFTVSYAGGSLTDTSVSNLLSSASTNALFGIGKSSNKLFLFVTKPDADTTTRIRYVTNNTFFDQINPSIGYPFEIEQNIISTILNYQDLTLSGNDSVQSGRYSLVITNNGTVNGKTQILVRIV